MTDTEPKSTITGNMGTLGTLPNYAANYEGLKGTLHQNDPTAGNVQVDINAASDDINARLDNAHSLGVAVELGGRTLKPGLYTAGTAMQSEYYCRIHCHAQPWP